MPETEATDKLLTQLKVLLGMPDAEEELLVERLQSIFEQNGYHALFGKTQGYYGPYIWRDTVPTVYRVELPGGTAEYTVNILKGFVFRSWMDYLTFGKHGTGGWASPDGTINCIEQAYDFESERFLVSLRASIDMQTALLNAAACSPDERVQAILSGLKADLCLTNCICAKICRIETEVLENFLTTGSASDSDKYKICIGCFILRSLWDLRVKENPENL